MFKKSTNKHIWTITAAYSNVLLTLLHNYRIFMDLQRFDCYIFFPCTGNCDERHPGRRKVPSVLRQLPSADHSWANTSCRDLLHPWTRARLLRGSHSYSHSDSYVWGGWRWRPSLPHGSRGNNYLNTFNNTLSTLMNRSVCPKGEVNLLLYYYFSFRKLMKPARESSEKLTTLALKLEISKSFPSIPHCPPSSSKGSLSHLLQESQTVP